jgi:hypothetical protein
MPRVPVKNLSHRVSDAPATALPLRRSSGPVICTTVFDGPRLFSHIPPERIRAVRVCPFLLGLLEQRSLHDLKG